MLSKGKLRIFLNKYFTSLNSHKLNGKNILIFFRLVNALCVLVNYTVSNSKSNCKSELDNYFKLKILENLIILYLMAGRHHSSYLFS